MREIINELLDKNIMDLSRLEEKSVVDSLSRRLEVEFRKQDKSGIYGKTQYRLTYNSNRIEGSRLSENQTVSLFTTGELVVDKEGVRSKDVEEATGHFLMFNNMIKTIEEDLSEALIKSYHFDLKSGVFEDAANGYAVGEYKERANIIGNIETASPLDVPGKMKDLIERYNRSNEKRLSDLARFHFEYERIHPLQDGNGRTGRIILFKECLKNGILPFIVQDNNKESYIRALSQSTPEDVSEVVEYFKQEQEVYFRDVKEFLYVLNREPIDKGAR